MKATTIVLLALTSVVPVLVNVSLATPVLAQADVVTESAVFTIENMYCELCPLTVKTAMERVPGVASVVVDFAAKTATVTFDPAVATVDAIAAASSGIGYPAHLASGA
ncbi:MAG: heavy-metal-associated domain-containing protein [Devosia sp.]|nr:heavy-metal-associated domain-containing protein [Devosia sp.]